jgi:hypothetical protein
VFSSDGIRSVAMTVAGPLVTQATCESKLRQYCNSTGHNQTHRHAMFYSFTIDNDEVIPGKSFLQDLSSFYLIRGPVRRQAPVLTESCHTL